MKDPKVKLGTTISPFDRIMVGFVVLTLIVLGAAVVAMAAYGLWSLGWWGLLAIPIAALVGGVSWAIGGRVV